MTNDVLSFNHDRDPKLDAYPYIRQILGYLEMDNGTPPYYFDNQAVIGLTYLPILDIEQLAKDAFIQTMSDDADKYTSAERSDTVASFLAFGERGEQEDFLEHNEQYKPLFQFLELAFGESDPEDLGFTTPHPEGLK